MKIILASASSRRQELLKRLTEEFSIIISNFDESSVNFNGDCGSYVEELALGKAKDVSYRVEGKSIIIGCDTVVSFKGRVLGKPKDKDEAFTMLKALSGNVHQVYSGIAVINKLTGRIIKDFVCTDVKFDILSDNQIEKYIEKEEYSDKAGAYGIQGYGGVFVEEIRGCYYNVVGLPLNKLLKMLKEMGVNL
ncbi:Maf-like protein [Clostridium sp. DJ247]|uniref:Maf-like protein n=1 Tax=Clostridium sp. DJ247 TaxID=2726188 RepID=UPI001626691C|nr:Maf-like protein [Clostridium sp. DJ247]MBC2580619.1 Maf-like protein [Clostridium sp. DJ247]